METVSDVNTIFVSYELPDCDFAVLSHGFLPHGRDYVLVIEDCIGRELCQPFENGRISMIVTAIAFSCNRPYLFV